ncbi:Drebrin-like protein [Sarcoptes scabiei]|nr:Drebrin-like protein [Sarcoptes scabiei]
MTINFYKNHDQIVSAYNEVLDPKCKTNWAVFGYEKQSNDLVLIAKGDAGLEELRQEFSQSNILYAFCELKDDSINLRRYILINWQGECAPLQRKGVCLNHFADVRDFFKDANIVLNARHEEDVEPDVLMQHVNKMASRIKIDKSNGFLNGHEGEEDIRDQLKPIGTNYRKTFAQQEISKKERESFWLKQKQEEEARLDEERRKSLSDKYDQLQVKRLDSHQNGNDSNHQDNHNEDNEPQYSALQSQLLRKERLEEAKSLISKKSISNARAFFERNSSATSNQINFKSPSSSTAANDSDSTKLNNKITPSNKNEILTEDKEHTNYAKPIENQFEQNREDLHDKKPETLPDESLITQSHDPNRSLPKNPLPEEIDEIVEKVIEIKNAEEEPLEEEEDDDDSGEEFITNPHVDLNPPQYSTYFTETRQLENIQEEEQNAEDDNVDEADRIRQKNDQQDSLGLTAKALYDYQAEISFDPDDLITHIEQIDSGWWQGLAPNGAYGLFPANYVELLNQ